MKHVGPSKDSIVLSGYGRLRGRLPLPVAMDPGLTVQLVEAVTGACWESRFTEASQQTPSKFISKSK